MLRQGILAVAKAARAQHPRSGGQLESDLDASPSARNMMKDDERIFLQSVLNTPKGELSDDDLFIFLGDESLSDEALLVSIDFVKTWLSKRALALLFDRA